ncbi:MAG: hypothetical protein HY606_15390 [Planctomycetes bacterium]|nr:hypothetical protein [Planctomycetota bacterium]
MGYLVLSYLFFSAFPIQDMNNPKPDPSLSQDEMTVKLKNGEQKVTLWIYKPDKIDPKKKYPAVIGLPPGDGSRYLTLGAYSKYWKDQVKKRKFFGLFVELEALKFSDFDDSKMLVETILKHINSKYSFVDDKKIAISGISNGGIGAMTSYILSCEKFAACFVFPGAYDENSVMKMEKSSVEKLKGKQLFMLVGENDREWKEGNDRMVEFLKKQGMKVRYEVLSRADHVFDVNPKILFDWAEKVFKDNEKELSKKK